MDQQAAAEVSAELGCTPYMVDCCQAVPMRRPRFCWTSETVEGQLADVFVTPERYWKTITAEAPYPATAQWPTWLGMGR